MIFIVKRLPGQTLLYICTICIIFDGLPFRIIYLLKIARLPAVLFTVHSLNIGFSFALLAALLKVASVRQRLNLSVGQLNSIEYVQDSCFLALLSSVVFFIHFLRLFPLGK